MISILTTMKASTAAKYSHIRFSTNSNMYLFRSCRYNDVISVIFTVKPLVSTTADNDIHFFAINTDI